MLVVAQPAAMAARVSRLVPAGLGWQGFFGLIWMSGTVSPRLTDWSRLDLKSAYLRRALIADFCQSLAAFSHQRHCDGLRGAEIWAEAGAVA